MGRIRPAAARGARCAAVAALLLATGSGPAATLDPPPGAWVIGDFSHATGGALPPAWTALEFPDIKSHTRYALVPDPERGQAVEAVARASASGLVLRLEADARERPLLRWSWKVENLVARGDLARKDGDDFAARLYVTFRYDPARATLWEKVRYGALKLIYGEYPPHSGLNYIWDARAPAGTIAPNAHTGRVRMLVVESSPARLGRWLDYERDIFADYRAAFGADPPPISGIAIMTDTDNTGETVRARYGDIALAPKAP